MGIQGGGERLGRLGGAWQNSALCATSETPVFMTLLGHNDTHCIVPHVKHTPAGRLRAEIGLGTISARNSRERRPRFRSLHFPQSLSRLCARALSSSVLLLPRGTFPSYHSSSFPHFIIHHAIKEMNVNRGRLFFLNASSHPYDSNSLGTRKVRNVSERKAAVSCCDDRLLRRLFEFLKRSSADGGCLSVNRLN